MVAVGAVIHKSGKVFGCLILAVFRPLSSFISASVIAAAFNHEIVFVDTAD